MKKYLKNNLVLWLFFCFGCFLVNFLISLVLYFGISLIFDFQLFIRVPIGISIIWTTIVLIANKNKINNFNEVIKNGNS